MQILTLVALALLMPWVAPPQAAPVRVVFETELGDIELELDAARAPVSVANFLKYADAGLYDGGIFHRTVRPDNQKAHAVPIAVVQAQSKARGAQELFPAIPLERTRDTGLKHVDGTVSMARLEPDTATDHFFICIGDQPELDFGGRRNPDGQGFAAFGRVVRGMDVVRKIQMANAEGERLSPPIGVLRVRRR
jgi:peptidyl-prolyl cis-trans isomerase A (cyclophilin A)